jgi:exonuclease III
MLQIAYKQDIDVLCVQELWTQASTQTQNYLGYDSYALVNNWEQDNKKEYNVIRPRVLIYIRKGLGLRVQQRRLVPSKDML